MTAVATLHQGDRVTLVADGGYFDPDGTIREIKSKLFIPPAALAAFTWRGGGAYAFLVRDRFLSLPSFDALLATAPADLGRARAWLDFRNPHWAEHDRMILMSVAGWSHERQALEAYRILAEGDGDFELMPIPLLRAGPCPVENEADLWDIVSPDEPIGSLEAWQALDTEQAALRLITAQREHWNPDEGTGLAAGRFVGGFAEMVTVTATSVTRKRLIDWHDPIGQKIHVAPAGVQ